MADTDHVEPTRSRESFNRVASLYDRYRRGYPEEVVDRLVAAAGIERGRRVLEIGPGTGQLTRPLLQRGAWVTAVELGQDLAALAQRNLADYPHFEMVVSSFEDWALPPHRISLDRRTHTSGEIGRGALPGRHPSRGVSSPCSRR